MFDTNSDDKAGEEGQATSTAAAAVQSNDGGDERFCKICYESEEADDEWVHPCRCSGTIKWVHRKCLGYWLENAPFQQRTQCTMCKYSYRKCWHLKPINRWNWPNFRLRFWDGLEIFLDVLTTCRCIRHISALIQGTAKSIFRSLAYIMFWRLFMMNDRRIDFYRRLGGTMISSVLETTIQDATV